MFPSDNEMGAQANGELSASFRSFNFDGKKNVVSLYELISKRDISLKFFIFTKKIFWFYSKLSELSLKKKKIPLPSFKFKNFTPTFINNFFLYLVRNFFSSGLFFPQKFHNFFLNYLQIFHNILSTHQNIFKFYLEFFKVLTSIFFKFC